MTTHLPPRSPSPLLVAGITALLALTFGIWALSESRTQRSETEAALRTEARLVAEALGPAMASAATSIRELEELLTWKLLDNALLLAPRDALRSDSELNQTLEMNGLSSLLWLDREAQAYKQMGEPVPPELLGELVREVAAGRSEEALLGSISTADGSDEIHAVAVSRPTGGALVVAARSSRLFAFDRQIGLQSLLEKMVETDALLFLAYREEPDNLGAVVVWDGGELPVLAEGEVALVRGEMIYGVEFPVDAPAGVTASLRVGLDADPLLRAADAAWRRTLLVGLAMVALSLAAAAFAFVQKARAREQQESRRALAELDRRRLQSERLAAAGTLAAGLAHEVRNPLNAISLAAQRIEQHAAEPERRDLIASLAKQTRREVENLDEVLRGFLELARPGNQEHERVDLRALTEGVVELLRIEAAERNVDLIIDGDPAETTVDSDSIRRALVNLVRNALQASPEGSRVTVSIVPRGRQIEIAVIDAGPGVDDEVLERAFEAFFTRSASGTGLGLSIVQRIAQEHRGSAGLDRHPGGGCRAWIRLPTDPAPAGIGATP